MCLHTKPKAYQLYTAGKVTAATELQGKAAESQSKNGIASTKVCDCDLYSAAFGGWWRGGEAEVKAIV
ncbi:hypothetical protein BJX99DRAFT_227100 [Aspergillus californicus]